MAAGRADALIVGGGVIGLLVARELRLAGLRPTILERDRPGHQASWASAGILHRTNPAEQDPESRLRNYSQDLYPDLARALREETGVDIECRLAPDGCLIPAHDERDATSLQAQAAALHRAGEAGEFLDRAALRQAEPALTERLHGALLLPGGSVDPRRLVRALELAETRAGTPIVAGAAATRILTAGDRVTGVQTLLGDYHAPIVVVAAGAWSGGIAGCDPLIPVVPQRGQILAVERGTIPLWRVVLTPNDPYLVPRVNGQLVVGATRELVGFDGRFTAGGIAWLLASAIALVPALVNAPIAEIWTGFRPLSRDGLPAIGRARPEGLYYATGHGPSGIAPAPGTARLLAALITGGDPPVPPAPFSPLRFA